MTEVNAKELAVIGELFDFFTKSAIDALKINFGDVVGKNFGFSIDKIDSIKDLSELKEKSLIVSKLNYTIFDNKRPLFMFTQREIVAQFADILTGGDGTGVNPESLSEVQINAFGGLISSLLESLERFFLNSYSEKLKMEVVSSTPIASSEQYDKISDSIEPKLYVELTLASGKKNKHKLFIVCDESSIVKNLKRMKLIEDLGEDTINLYNLGRISDIWVKLEVMLGDAKIPLKRALELDFGSLVELDAIKNTDVGVFVDNVEIAKAQIVAVEGNFGIKITKILDTKSWRK